MLADCTTFSNALSVFSVIMSVSVGVSPTVTAQQNAENISVESRPSARCLYHYILDSDVRTQVMSTADTPLSATGDNGSLDPDV